MEYLSGRPLQRLIDYNRTLSLDVILYIFLSVARGLIGIHNQGFIHGDITPRNIFATVNGEIKLLDFGASQLIGESEETVMPYTVGLSTGYAPPEWYQSTTPRSPSGDVYSLAAVLYYMFMKEKLPEPLAMLIDDPTLQSLRINDKTMNKSLVAVLKKALCLNRLDRYQTVQSFVDELLEAVY
jgi:serine/threonine protein kinase